MMTDWQLTTAKTVESARTILASHRRRLLDARVPGHLDLTGGSSIEGLLTKGDIDLHLRVAPKEFDVAVSRLRPLYQAVLPGIWTSWFAVFEEAAQPPVGIAVTVRDSEHDRRFVRSWERMRAEEAVRRQYNLVKRDDQDVEAAKSRFFDELARE